MCLEKLLSDQKPPIQNCKGIAPIKPFSDIFVKNMLDHHLNNHS